MPSKNPSKKIDWQNHIRTQKESKQTAKAYCVQHSLNYDQFGYYKRKGCAAQSEQSSGFAVVQVEQPLSKPSVDGIIRPQGLILSLPSGLRIEGIDADNLSLCLSLASQLS